MDIQLEPDFDYISLAHSACLIIERFNKLYRLEYLTWDELDDSDKAIYVILTKYIVDNKKSITPKMIHDKWKELMLDNGWKYKKNYTNLYRKWHDSLIEYEELSGKQQAKDKLLLSVVLGIQDLFLED